MDIFINQQSYTRLTDEAGVRVVLTDQSRMPFPFDEGFSIPTGFATSIGIKRVIVLTYMILLYLYYIILLLLYYVVGRTNCVVVLYKSLQLVER